MSVLDTDPGSPLNDAMRGYVFLDGMPLAVRPRVISWGYTLKTATHKTIGGKVIQVYGVKMGDLVVGGKMKLADYRTFYLQVKAIADAQVPTFANPRPSPVRFFWPARGWDFWVYVKSMSSGGAEVSMVESNENFAPEWRMTLFVAEDNADIVQVAQEAAKAAFIRRITQGLGWVQSEWNGPLDIDPELSAAIDGKTLLQFLFDKQAELDAANGQAETPSTSNDTSGAGTPNPP